MQNTSHKSPQHITFAKKQKGAAAIEFALVFVVFFAVLYGLLSYSLPLLLVQSFNTAVTEAVRQAVAIDPTTANYNNTVTSQVTATITNQLSWMPTALAFDASNLSYVNPVFDGHLLTVTINYPQSKLTSVLPLIVLPFVGTVPNLPANLTATASLQLVP